MKMTGNKGFAIFLIALGGLILLSKAGPIIGHVLATAISFIIPILLIYFGYLGVKNGRNLIGWLLVIIGSIILISKLSWLIGLVVAIGFIAYGVSILRKRVV